MISQLSWGPAAHGTKEPMVGPASSQLTSTLLHQLVGLPLDVAAHGDMCQEQLDRWGALDIGRQVPVDGHRLVQSLCQGTATTFWPAAMFIAMLWPADPYHLCLPDAPIPGGATRNRKIITFSSKVIRF